ncbi:MAG: hypothetical protein ACI9C4_002533 [Paraglaciecola sp.]|jgi:hypothetical protein
MLNTDMASAADSATLAPLDYTFFQNVRMGQFLDVEIQNNQNDRFKSFLIGVKQGQYLILEQPDSKRFGFARDLLVEGQSIIIRTICEQTTGECIAFRAFVKGIINHPQKLLFVSFPEDIQKRELRIEQRKALRYPAQIYMTNQGERISGVITDMSDGGCRFEMQVSDTVKGVKQDNVYIEFEHPDIGFLQEVHCKVCSQRKILDIVSIGLAFKQPLKIKG